MAMNTFPTDVEAVLGELRAVRAQAEQQLAGNTYFATVNRLDELSAWLQEAQSSDEVTEQFLRTIVFEMDGIRARHGLRITPSLASAPGQPEPVASEAAEPEEQPTGNVFYLQAATAALTAGEAAREAGMSVQDFARSVAEKSGETAQSFAESVAGRASEVASTAIESAREAGTSVRELAQSVAQQASETSQQAEGAARETVEEAQSWAQSVAEKSGETAENFAQSVAQQASETTQQATEDVKSWAQSAQETAERYIQPAEESGSAQPTQAEEPVEEHVSAQASAEEQPASPPVSDLSGVRIDTSEAGDSGAASTAQHGASSSESAAQQAPQDRQADERSEGAMARFFRALFGRKS